MMLILIHIAFLLALWALVLVRMRTLLAYFQQDEYNDKRFFEGLAETGLIDKRASILAISAYVLAVITGAYVTFTAVAAIGFGIIAAMEYRYKFKKALVMTERARRLYTLAIGFGLILMGLLFVRIETTILIVHALPLCLILSNKILTPYQERLNQGFITKATDKLADLDPITIGITGSFGKTTVKHILAELLRQDAPVFYSRGSINTVLGLTRHIRARLQPAHKYFIAEMGAYGIGSIKRLCDFADPDYGILTSIGDAHAERFGGLENTAKAKSELAAHICETGRKIIVTRDVLRHAPVADLQARHPEKFVIVGHEAGDDVVIRAAAFADGMWSITLGFEAHPELDDMTFALPLLGDHNVMNLALCVALVAEVAPQAVAQLRYVAPDVEQIPHRLEKRPHFGHGPVVLDDAFNSNETGFVNAVEVLRAMADDAGGKAVLVTPGLAELGVEHEAVHGRVGLAAAKMCDHVVVVNPDRIPTFIQALREEGAHYITAPTLAAARKEIDALELGAKDVLLYENDLPDVLEEKRLL